MNNSLIKNEPNQINKRSVRQIKKVKPDDSFISSLNDSEEIISSKNSQNNIQSENILRDNLIEEDEIVMEGNLLYRYTQDQIEIDGTWSMSSEKEKNKPYKFSYLLSQNKNKEVIQIPIKKEDIDFSFYEPSINASKYMSNDNEHFILNLCNANIFEILLIPNQELFNNILTMLTGEYHGFFFYFSKTIEDRFYLNYTFEDNQVRVNGKGNNNLGEFNFLGYVNFFTIKEQLFENNNLDSEIINFGKIKLIRNYNAFNTNENNRVIKSYQHSRKRNDEYDESI
jgi:hypothetical protein